MQTHSAINISIVNQKVAAYKHNKIDGWINIDGNDMETRNSLIDRMA